MIMHVNELHSSRLLNPIGNETSLLLENNDTSLSAGMTSAHRQSDGFILSIVCFVILLPCMLAVCAQSVYCAKKRRQDRIDRQLLAVSTNPTSRMLVLSEIFKNDIRPVTKDEAYANKKKSVLVKKHRKKTPLERQRRPTDGINMNLSNEAFNPDDNTVRVERYQQSNECDVEDQMNETWWDEDDGSISDGEKPMTVHISGKVEQAVISNEEQPLEQDNVSNLDGEEHDAVDCEHERRVPGGATFEMEGQWIDIQPDAECGEGKGVGGSIFESEDEDGSERIIENADFNTDSMVSSMTTGLRHDVKEENYKSPEIMHSVLENLDSSVKMTESTKTEVSPGLFTHEKTSNRANELKLGTSLKSSPDVTLAKPNNPLDMPFLSAAESPSNVNLSPRALSPQTLFVDMTTVDMTAEPVISGLRSMPDTNDDNSDDGDARRTGIHSLFRGTEQDDGCGSHVTEVTSNIDVKEIGGWIVEPLLLAPTKCTDISGPSLYCHLSTVNHLGEAGVIPMEKSGNNNSTERSVVTYFSYEDISIASEESEMCAICLCAYEEGDRRIFSKRCSHAFHKECILEWLVKSQQCPCCRIEMVTKSQIKEISASLIGTERLTQAMAVVNESGMQEGSPFRVRRPRLARQSLFTARAQGRTSFRAGRLSPFATRPPSMTSSPTPRTSRTDDSNLHNRDWLWTTRFIDDAQPRTINPTRSSDAIMNPHETQTSTTSVPGIPSMHSSVAGSLFSTNGSFVHDHWQQSRTSPSARREGSQIGSIVHDNWHQPRTPPSERRDRRQPVHLHASTAHSYWRQATNSASHLPVITLPAV